MADVRQISAAVAVAIICKRRKRKRKTKEVWEREWFRRRSERGVYRQLLEELRLEDEENYRRYLRMDTKTFQDLLDKVTPLIEKKQTNMRQPIPPGERLAVTLRFLATGESFSSLQYQFRISASSLSFIVPEVCQAVFQVLKDDYFKCPSAPEEWLKIAQLFHDCWQLPHCIGAADGKHVRILHPRNSGSEFYNYKGFFSVVLLAVVDADYKFIFADVGCQGRISDGGVLRNSLFWKALVNGSLGLPQPRLLPESTDKSFDGSYTNKPVSFYLAGDDAFPLENYIMKPYSQRNLSEEKRIFNYRLSRARRISENAFGILSSRFRVFSTVMCAKPESAIKIVLCAITLHNFLRSRVPERYIPTGALDTEHSNGVVTEGSWRREIATTPFASVPNSRKGRQPRKAEEMREQLCDYLNGPGQVPWQWNVLI